MSLSIYPIGNYISQTVSTMLYGSGPLETLLVRDLVMATAKAPKQINPKFFGKDRNASEVAVVDAIDLGERKGVLAVEYSQNAKGYDVMTVAPTEEAMRRLTEAKEEAAARFSR